MKINIAYDIFGGILPGGLGIMGILGTIFWVALIAVPALGLIIGFFWWIHRKKKWNLDVEFKLPRSDGKLVDAEWGRGCFNTKRGVVLLKRKRKKAIPMKPFKIGKFLQGSRTLTVIQIAPETYIPVLNHSWIEMENDKPLRNDKGKLIRDESGKPVYEKAALMKIRIDNTESKAWKNAFEREAKAAYSITSLLERYAPYIGIAMILVFNFIGFAILWTKVA